MKVLKKLIGLLITIIIIAFVSIVVIDYLNALKDRDLIFCVSENTKEYDDGTVYECVGIGYKYYKYDRSNIKASEFGPFFIDEKSPEQLKKEV